MARVLIVGSGLTGSVIKHYLSGWLTGAAAHQNAWSITTWEAESASGGRMQNDFFIGPHRCDLGAQYISQNISGELQYYDIYDFLRDEGSFSLLQNNALVSGMRTEHQDGQHFIATSGTSNIPTALAPQGDIHFEKKLVSLAYDEGASKLLAIAENNDEAQAFDAIVLTMPTPQLLQVLHPVAEQPTKLLPNSLLERLQRVRYSSRFALAAYYELPSAGAKQSVLDSVPWRAKYVMDDDVVRYVSIENFKYENAINAADPNTASHNAEEQHILSILVHTSVPFGLTHPEVLKYCSPQSQGGARVPVDAALEAGKKSVIDTILQHLTGPSALPALSTYTPVRMRLVGWEQSQVSRGFHSAEAEKAAERCADNSRGVLTGPRGDQPPAVLLSTQAPWSARFIDADGEVVIGGASIHEAADGALLRVITQDSSPAPGPLLVLAGDAFTESNFDGCVKSGRFAAQAVIKHLNLTL